MKLCIEWDIYLRVTTDAKCEKALGKIRNAIGLELEVTLMERYWKDQQLYRVRAATCIQAQTTTDGFYAIMKSINGLASQWTVNSPTDVGTWEFAGTAVQSTLRFPEIESVDFSSIGDHDAVINPAVMHI